METIRKRSLTRRLTPNPDKWVDIKHTTYVLTEHSAFNVYIKKLNPSLPLLHTYASYSRTYSVLL